jgi:hypothetical protein
VRSSDAAASQLFFERGREASERGDPAEACKNFDESLRLDFAVGTLFNLAVCEEALGRFASAWQHLHEGIDKLDEQDSRLKPAVAAAKALERRVPKLTIVFGAGESGQVLRDGVELSAVSLGAALPVNPGVHTVRVRAPGRLDSSVRVDLAEAELRTLTVAAGPLAAVTAEPLLQPTLAQHRLPVQGSPVRSAGWVSIGGAATATGVALLAGALALERAQVVRSHCDSERVCDQTGLDALSRSKTYATVSTIAFISAGVLLVGGVVLLAVGRPDSAQRLSSGTLLRF